MYKGFIQFFILSPLFFLVVSSALADAVLDQFFSATHSMQAEFRQSVSERFGKVIEQSSGSIIIQRPHRFVLNYQQPETQQYVSDGKTLWIYDEELEQVTIKSFDHSLANSPALFISSNQQINDSYHISRGHDPERPQLKIIKLLPKQEENLFSFVYLAFDDGYLVELVMQDNFEQVTKLEFSEIKINQTLPQDTFIFKVPADVDVIGTVNSTDSIPGNAKLN